MHDTEARLFKNHYEAQVRSLASFWKADLLAFTMESGAAGGGEVGVGVRGGRQFCEERKTERKKVKDAKRPWCMLGEKDVLI